MDAQFKRIVIQKTGSVVLKRTRSKALAKLARMPRTPLFAVASVVEDGVLYLVVVVSQPPLAAHVVVHPVVHGHGWRCNFWGLREGLVMVTINHEPLVLPLWSLEL